MSDEKIHVCHGTLIVTFRCTLKCKLCCVYAPYYKAKSDYSTEKLEETIDMFFKLVDLCDVFNIQGGEPLMHKDLPRIIEKTMGYKDRMQQVLLTTNGTLLPNESLINVLKAYRNDIKVHISNYGPELSRKVPEVIRILEENEIPYDVFKYYGEDMHYGGWLDFTDHTYKNMTEQEIIEQCKDCGCRNSPQFAVRDGQMFCCGRVMRRMDLGIIEKNEKAYVEMFDDRSIEEKRRNVRDIIEAEYTPSCPYCTGKRLERVHCMPAEQLTDEEIEKGIEIIDK